MVIIFSVTLFFFLVKYGFLMFPQLWELSDIFDPIGSTASIFRAPDNGYIDKSELDIYTVGGMKYITITEISSYHQPLLLFQ